MDFYFWDAALVARRALGSQVSFRALLVPTGFNRVDHTTRRWAATIRVRVQKKCMVLRPSGSRANSHHKRERSWALYGHIGASSERLLPGGTSIALVDLGLC